MKKLISLALLASLLIPVTLPAQSQSKLEENLKAVMLLFDKNRQEAETEINSLTILNDQLAVRNSQLNKELEDSWKKIQELESENLLLRSKISEGAILEIETAALTPSMASPRKKKKAAPEPIPDFTPAAFQEIAPPANGAAHLSEGTVLLVDINSATERELKMIPGIGPQMARKVVNGRPYHSIWDLMKIQGMGRKRIESISPYITLE